MWGLSEVLEHTHLQVEQPVLTFGWPFRAIGNIGYLANVDKRVFGDLKPRRRLPRLLKYRRMRFIGFCSGDVALRIRRMRG